MAKEAPEGLKLATFKNWLDTRPKMETHEPNVYPPILGGVSQGFWSPFEDLGARSAIFWHLKTGTFATTITTTTFTVSHVPHYYIHYCLPCQTATTTTLRIELKIELKLTIEVR